MFSTLSGLLEWLCDPSRIPFYIGDRLPVLPVSFLLGGKLNCVKNPHRLSSKLAQETQVAVVAYAFGSRRHSPREKVQDVTDITGRHYELASILLQTLGCKVESVFRAISFFSGGLRPLKSAMMSYSVPGPLSSARPSTRAKGRSVLVQECRTTASFFQEVPLW
jgi:hypothetical protein